MSIADITNPALRALVQLSKDGVVMLSWSDGDAVLVRYDTFIPSDETHDGSEEWVVDVIDVISAGASSTRNLRAGSPATITSGDPPTTVESPDRSRRWP